ncbi:MAG: ribonuclease R [Rubricella sp.]
MSTLPTKDQILDWMREHPGHSAKRDIAKAFGIRGAGRVELKRMLKELEADGLIERGRRKSFREAGTLPPVAVLRVLGPDEDGELLAEPTEWEGDEPPHLRVIERKGDGALGKGDRILARIGREEGPERHHHVARVIRKIGTGPRRILGIYRQGAEGGRVDPVEKKADKSFIIPAGERNGARDGDLVEAEAFGNPRRMGLPKARIVERLGDPGAPKSVSLIAIHEYGIPDEFPDAAVKEALRARPVALGSREDLRHLPLITIDPPDARDHDDAVCALPDPAEDNPGGHILWVAIADVAHYVRPGSALDREARRRGNSTYFPDRVVPMLPEQLSGDLCSLHEGVDRPCIALELRIGPQGERRGARFTRGLMRNPASLSYAEAQAAVDGHVSDKTAALLEPVLKPLFAAYGALKAAREVRAPLHLDLPERRIELSETGEVLSVAFRERFDAHKLIEELMIAANVAAAEVLERKRKPLLYRVHEQPNPEKLDALREVIEGVGLRLPKGQVLKTRHLNQLLDAVAGTDNAEAVNMAVLRSMTQAYYSPENYGHFGLHLRRYAHFTSPIRRYADLVVHRALIAAHGWGDDGLAGDEIEHLESTAEHISETERRSMQAERDTIDRYLAAYLSERVGTTIGGRISGVARFGIFVKLDETGADGLVPISRIGQEYFRHNPEAQTLTGERTGRVLSAGQRVVVRIEEATPITGGLLLELIETDDGGIRRTSRRGAARPGRKGKPAAKLRRNRKRR